jgi:hypothetical protein
MLLSGEAIVGFPSAVIYRTFDQVLDFEVNGGLVSGEVCRPAETARTAVGQADVSI